jgi:hypothetical protein
LACPPVQPPLSLQQRLLVATLRLAPSLAMTANSVLQSGSGANGSGIGSAVGAGTYLELKLDSSSTSSPTVATMSTLFALLLAKAVVFFGSRLRNGKGEGAAAGTGAALFALGARQDDHTGSFSVAGLSL